MPFVGEIRMFGGNFEPAGWKFCKGQLLNIAQNPDLFTAIGTTYGGDGQTTFALPDLRGRMPVHVGTLGGNTLTLGETGGTEEVTLTVQQIPIHTHPALCLAGAGNQANPSNNFFAGTQSGTQIYADPPNASGAEVPMKPQNISPAGGSQPHENRMPFLVINFLIRTTP